MKTNLQRLSLSQMNVHRTALESILGALPTPDMTPTLALIVSCLALLVSATTGWLTLFRKGTIRMTQPTVIFFGQEVSERHGRPHSPKVFLRTLLVSTSKRGRVIESMYVSLTRSESHQSFGVWVHGDERLTRGSGLFVGETGVSANHHFMMPPDDRPNFAFSAGNYRIDVYAKLLGDRSNLLLFSQQLELQSEHATLLRNPQAGVYFDWGQESQRYLAHVDDRGTEKPEEQQLDQLDARILNAAIEFNASRVGATSSGLE